MSRPLLTSYQRWVASDPHRSVAMDKARRIGGSFGAAHRAALRGMGFMVRDGQLLDNPLGPVPQKLVSASQEQANELLAECLQHVEAIARVYPDPSVWPDGSPAKMRFKLRNGVAFRAIPDNPRTARGGEGDVTLDEFAFSRDAKAMWSAVKPITDPNLANPRGYQLTVITTPLAEGSLAHRICRGDGSKHDLFRHFSRYHIDIYSAVRRGFPDPSASAEARAAFIERMREEAGDPATFAQEYECSWLAANAQFIPLGLLNDRRYEPGDLPVEGEEYCGYDVARKKHLAVLATVRKVGDVLWCLPMEEGRDVLRQAPFELQEDRCSKAIQDGARRLCIDATGMGSAPAEKLRKKHLGKVEAIEFTSAVKEELATTMKLALEQGRLRIPYDRDLIYDLASLRKIVSGAGNIRYDADDSGGSHADRAWALALAVHAAIKPRAKATSFRIHGL
jgi:phage FluMu gp28-like protein